MTKKWYKINSYIHKLPSTMAFKSSYAYVCHTVRLLRQQAECLPFQDTRVRGHEGHEGTGGTRIRRVLRGYDGGVQEVHEHILQVVKHIQIGILVCHIRAPRRLISKGINNTTQAIICVFHIRAPRAMRSCKAKVAAWAPIKQAAA